VRIVLDLPPSIWAEVSEALDELARVKVRNGDERASEYLLEASAEIENKLYSE